MPAAVTHNPHCDQVRAAAKKAQAGWTLPADTIDIAIVQAEAAAAILRDVYRLVQSHPTLSVQCEVAGKSARHLVGCLEARRAGQAP